MLKIGVTQTENEFSNAVDTDQVAPTGHSR
jgi:hypothetical protein